MGGRIIVGVDGSGPSGAALSWACARARATGHPMLAIHVVEHDDERSAGEDALDSAVHRVQSSAPDIAIQAQLMSGAAPWQLTGSARSDDLLVVGTHKTGYVSGRVLGTRSIAIATGAASSVAVIPDRPPGQSGVLVGVATVATSRTAIIEGAREAARTGHELTLLHAVGPSEIGRAELAEAVALAIATSPGLVVRSRQSRRRPAEALLDASRSSTLLVLGATDPSNVHAHQLGSVLYEVLLNINSPVLIARG